ncbi:FMN-dependent NADH-azoreductase [Neobacillus sp. LXY-4]|uniref:FMN-dependent NADH-azoreductase n=1 Tax=Neobacillus sp. LXY-4 TaxID=3379826 RepID=UPI003EE28CC8
MAKLLYITANPKGLEKSKGLQIGEAFLEAFQAELPDAEIKKIDLFEADIPQMDAELVSARGKIGGYGYKLEELEEGEREKYLAMHAVADEFVNYDYFVFVSPVWNLSSPPVLKQYMDNLFVSGKTFNYTPEGAKGALSGKKAVHIQTRGGLYTNTPMAELESGDRYLKIALKFLGIEVLDTVVAEGFDYFPKQVEEILEAAKEKARETAKQMAGAELTV